jgi:predicted dehydrogenase
MNKKLGFGVIGCGRMGRRRVDLIRSHPRAELRCIEDCSNEIARRVSTEVGCDYYSGWENVVRRPDIDCVVVSVPNKFHYDIVIATLEAGKHVFCEKPLARNPIEAQRMVKAAERSGRFLKVGSNLRYFPSVLKTKELLDNGEIGEILFARGWIGHSGWQIGTWYSDSEIIGGGTLLDNGCHLVDLYRWFLGEVESCVGFVSTSLWPISPLEDNAMALFKFTGGKIAFLQSSWTEWAGYMYLEIYGTQGFIRIDNRGQSCITTLGKREGQNTVFDYSKEPPKSYVLEFDDYVKAITTDRQPLPSGLDGLRAVQMAHAVYQSAQQGREIKILEGNRL